MENGAPKKPVVVSDRFWEVIILYMNKALTYLDTFKLKRMLQK